MSRNHIPLLRSRRWQAVRRAVLDRDGWRCRACGRWGNECDHVVPLHRDPGQNPCDMDGLQTLCRGCHIAKTAGENRRPLTAAERAWAALVDDMRNVIT